MKYSGAMAVPSNPFHPPSNCQPLSAWSSLGSVELNVGSSVEAKMIPHASTARRETASVRARTLNIILHCTVHLRGKPRCWMSEAENVPRTFSSDQSEKAHRAASPLLKSRQTACFV